MYMNNARYRNTSKLLVLVEMSTLEKIAPNFPFSRENNGLIKNNELDKICCLETRMRPGTSTSFRSH